MLKDLFKNKEIKKFKKVAETVLVLESKYSKMSNSELKLASDNLRETLRVDTTPDDILPDAFALCREAAFRAIGLKPFMVQVMGGIVLHSGNIAEMKTGEGKTLVVTLPAYLNALAGKKVHIITVNEYLAKRDKEWMGKIFNFLGLSVGLVYSGQSKEEKKAAYACDIVYGTNSEIGFDFLRDNMVTKIEDKVQCGLGYAIIDEVDSVLIDDARIPLIITNPSLESEEIFLKADLFSKSLEPDAYELEEKEKAVSLTETGIKKAELFFNVENLADIENTTLFHHINTALRARFYMVKDKDYIIKNEKLVLVDPSTGRLAPTKMFGDGVHQAIEAKEGLKLTPESSTEATITYQNFFKLYDKIAGMTGTAITEEEEFNDIYNLSVYPIPTNKPIARIDHNDIVYKSTKEKWYAIVELIKEKYDMGQPVLVGTTSIEKSEFLSNLLNEANLPHKVLNAKNHEEEAHIVASAGRYKAITVATNMAGRGTDILLGGNLEEKAKEKLLQSYGVDYDTILTNECLTDDMKDTYLSLYNDIVKEIKHNDTEKLMVEKLGGLCVIGTERHDSRRIDNQLRGRAGRQGDPGMSVFFLSLEDDLLRLFGGEKIKALAENLNLKENTPISSNLLSNTVERSQKIIESIHYASRKNLVKYEGVLSIQRGIIYKQRDNVLQMDYKTLYQTIEAMLDDKIENLLNETLDLDKESFNLDALSTVLKENFFINISFDQSKSDVSINTIKASLLNLTKDILCNIYKPEATNYLKQQLLGSIDKYWKRYIHDIDIVKNEIGTRGFGNQDPSIAFDEEAYELYNLMLNDIKNDFIKKLFKPIDSSNVA